MMTQIIMATNTPPHRLPPLKYPKSVSPSRDSTEQLDPAARAVLETRGITAEGSGSKDRYKKAARKREQARRHLSNSLQGLRTILPDLRRTQSFNVPVPPAGNERDSSRMGTVTRDTGSLGSPKPFHDLHNVRAEAGRRHSLKETGSGRRESPSHPLSLSLPQPPANVSLAALVHELNASMHHHSPPSQPNNSPDSSLNDDDDSIDNLFDYENGLDPDLCPRLTGQDASEVPERTLTPALRKLNRRRVSSRVRTQQWVNQIERVQRHSGKSRETEAGSGLIPQVALLYEHGS